MRTLRNIQQTHKILRGIKKKSKTIGFVPTMGALHRGHLSLIRKARKDNDCVVVSIFVNPAQFGPKEDFKKYPRNLKSDAYLCRRENVDFIFYPEADQMYPNNFKTCVTVEDLSDALCGKSRPKHFRGVATVVTKLFNIVQPDIAYFGQKDAQQAIIIRRLVEDLNMPIKIKVLPIVRDNDGLALSSRNIYLNEQERESALVIFEALNLAKGLIRQGKRESRYIINAMRRLVNKKKARIDYIEILDPNDLRSVRFISGRVLVALAVWIGKTRLIDNIIVN